METLRSYRIHPKKAHEMVRASILAGAALIPGFLREEFEGRAAWDYDLSARFRRGREEVTLHFDLRRDLVEFDCGRGSVWRPEVQVSWSSTHRTPARARAAVALYAAVVDLACQVESEILEEQVAQTLEEGKAEHEAEEKAARAAAVHAAGEAPLATLCGLTSGDMADGSRGTAVLVAVSETAYSVGSGVASVTCAGCNQALREEVAKLARSAKRAAARAATRRMELVSAAASLALGVPRQDVSRIADRMLADDPGVSAEEVAEEAQAAHEAGAKAGEAVRS